jgi:hypothetical protein
MNSHVPSCVDPACKMPRALPPRSSRCSSPRRVRRRQLAARSGPAVRPSELLELKNVVGPKQHGSAAAVTSRSAQVMQDPRIGQFAPGTRCAPRAYGLQFPGCSSEAGRKRECKT